MQKNQKGKNISVDLKRGGWVLSILLLIGALAILFYLKEDLLRYFQSSGEMGAILDMNYVYKFILSLGLSVVGTGVFIYYRAKQLKVASHTNRIILLFLFSVLFDFTLMSASLALLGFLGKIEFRPHLYDVYLVNFLVFVSLVILFLDKMMRKLKREDDIVRVINSIFMDEYKGSMFFVMPAVSVFIALMLLVNIEVQYLFLCIHLAILISLYSSTIFISHVAKVVDKILILKKKRYGS